MFDKLFNKNPKFQENHKFTYDGVYYNIQYTVKRVIKPNIGGYIISFTPDPTRRTYAEIQAGRRTGRKRQTEDFFEDKQDTLGKYFDQESGGDVVLTIDTNDKITSVAQREKNTTKEDIINEGKIPGWLSEKILPESFTRYLAFMDEIPGVFSTFKESELLNLPVVSSTSPLSAVVGGLATAHPSGYRNKTKRGRRKSRHLRHKKSTRRRRRKY